MNYVRSQFQPVILAVFMVLFMSANELYAAVIQAGEIKSTIEQYIVELYKKEGVEIEVSVPRMYDVDIGNASSTDLHVFHDVEKIFGRRLPLIVEIKNDRGIVIKQIKVTARLKYFANAAVINCEIRRGEPIRISDVDVKKVEITGLKNFYTSPAELNCMQAKKNIRAGTVMTSSNVRSAYIIKRGDKVNVQVHGGNILIEAKGTARGNGAKGEYINIFVDMTKTTITCKIVDSKTVITGIEGG